MTIKINSTITKEGIITVKIKDKNEGDKLLTEFKNEINSDNIYDYDYRIEEMFDHLNKFSY